MNKSKKPIRLSTETDIPILSFLWLWKVATTNTLATHLFRNHFEDYHFSTYHRLLRLQRSGFVELQHEKRGQFKVWTLTKKGFEAVKDLFPPLKETGFKSENINHDTLVTAVHLGEWVTGIPRGVEFITEQQLRRYHSQALASWVPSPDNHRPDGYWSIPVAGGSHLFSLEVEVSKKVPTEYESVSYFYDRETSIARVMWIVGNKALAQMMSRIFAAKNPSYHKKHSFFLLSDLKKHGWSSKPILGADQNQSLYSTLVQGYACGSDTIPSRIQHSSVENVLLDSKTRPSKTITLAQSSNSDHPTQSRLLGT
ncbi:MAG: hypothetical protein AB7F66_11040 [Bacteriovoracia bacterium]